MTSIYMTTNVHIICVPETATQRQSAFRGQHIVLNNQRQVLFKC